MLEKLFPKACRLADKILRKDGKKLEEKNSRLKLEVKKALDLAKMAEVELEAVSHLPEDHPQRRRRERKLEKARKTYERKKRILEQESFKKAIYFTNLNVELHEVLSLALLSFLGILAVLILLDILLLSTNPTLLFYLLPLTFVLPLSAYTFVTSYPDILARRMRIKSLGRAPEAVNYMVMSMSLSPSLNKAIEFAAENSEEPLASGLRKSLWDVYSRKYSGIEESFLAFAYEWGEWNEDLKRSFYAIRSSILEGNEEGLHQSLDKARQIIFEGTRRKMEEYASSLRAPTTMLFALGILLPMIIGSMLPMISVGGLNFSIIQGGGPIQTGDNSAIIFFLMDILFPAATFGYAYHILGKRPGTSTPPSVPSVLSKKKRILAGLIALSILLALSSLIVLPIGPASSLLPLWGVVLSSAYWLKTTTKDQKKKRDEMKRMEDQFPDALFQLGSRIAEGLPLELALKKTSETMKGAQISSFFEKISYNLQVTRSSLDQVLFGSSGLLIHFPSRAIKATMKMVVEIVKKDPVMAGRMIINMSTYLRELEEIEDHIKKELSSVVETMKSTALFFAPIVLGVTCSLYILLSRAFSSFATLPVDPLVFFLIVGIYLLATVFTIIYFSTGIENGEDRIEFKANLSYGLPIALAVFSLSILVGQVGLRV